MSVKMSGTVLYGGGFLYSFFYVFRATRKEAKRCASVGVVVSLVLFLSFVFHNLISSGWPLYPIPLGEIPFSFLVPKEQLAELLISIKGWARLPGESYRDSIMYGFWYWFIPWYKRFYQTQEWYLAFGSMINIAITFTHLTFFSAMKMKKQITIGLFVIFLSLVLWSYAAPDVRIGSVFFWIFFSLTIIPVMDMVVNHNKKAEIILLCIPLYITIGFMGRGMLLDLPPEYFVLHPSPESIIGTDIEKTEVNGTVLYRPLKADFCGNTLFLCTPNINPLLKLVDPQDIRK